MLLKFLHKEKSKIPKFNFFNEIQPSNMDSHEVIWEQSKLDKSISIRSLQFLNKKLQSYNFFLNIIFIVYIPSFLNFKK